MEMKTALRKFDILTGNDYLVSPSRAYFAKLNVEDGEAYGQIEVYKGSDPDHAEGKWTWRSQWKDDMRSYSNASLFFFLRGPGVIIGAAAQDELDEIISRQDAANESERAGMLDNLIQRHNNAITQYSLFSGSLREEFHLILQDDGNLVVRKGTVDAPGEPVWSSLVELNTENEPPVVKDVKQTWLHEVKYDEMKIGETRILLSFGNDKYVLMQGNKVDPETMPIDIGEVHSGVQVTKNFLGPSFAIIAAASIIHSGTTGSNDLSSVDFSLFTPQAKAEISSSYVGAGASLNLIDGQVSVFNITLGLGVDTGIGIKDDSVTFEVLGTGFQVGRVVSVSAVGSSFGIDFGRVFNSIF